MPKIIIKKDDLLLRKISIPDDILAFTVGSEQGNDIIIKDERISFFHLQFEKQGSDYYVRDLQSQWGTYINGRKINGRTILNDNDNIGLGYHILTFVNPSTDADAPQRSDKYELESVASQSNFEQRVAGAPTLSNLNTWIQEDQVPIEKKPPSMRPPDDIEASTIGLLKDETDDLIHDGEEADPKPEPPKPDPIETYKIDNDGPEENIEFEPQTYFEREKSATPALDFNDAHVEETENEPEIASKNYYLLGIYGYYLGRKFRITTPETRIGRDRKLNHIVIKRNSKGKIDQSVSRRHAKITYKNKKYKLTDKRSKSRTYINRKKLETDEEVELRTGDEIEIISDRKSHILRFVPEGKWDFSFPKKAGAWHIRHRMKILNVYSLIVILLACFFFGKAFLVRDIITERPKPLMVQEQNWYSGSANGQTNGANHLESLSQPAMADLNGDNLLDLIFITNEGSLTSLSGLSKTPLWINDEVDAIPNIPVTVADLNNDGKSDLIVVSNDSRLRAIDGNWGIEIWRSPILAGPLIGPPVVDDFNGDGLNDLAISSSTNAVYLGYSSLRNSRWIKLDLEAQVRGIASAGDVTLDGIPEVIIGTDTGKIVFIDGTKEKIWGEININEELNKATGRFNQNNQIRHPVGYGDLNGDGTPDLLVTTLQGNIIALDGSTLERLWYDLSDASPDTQSSSEGGTALGDLDGDGLPDVVSVFPDGELKALKGTGQARDRKMLIWRKPPRGPDRFTGKPALTDLNKNGTLDVIVANNTGALHILEGATGELLWREKGVRKPVIGSALVGDLDNDHGLDIIALKANGKFYKLATNSTTYENSVVWGQVFGNNKNTSSATIKKEKISRYYANMGISVGVIAAVLALHFFFRNRRKKLGQMY